MTIASRVRRSTARIAAGGRESFLQRCSVAHVTVKVKGFVSAKVLIETNRALRSMTIATGITNRVSP